MLCILKNIWKKEYIPLVLTKIPPQNDNGLLIFENKKRKVENF